MTPDGGADRLATALADSLPDRTARAAVVAVDRDPGGWLSDAERTRLAAFRVAKRRREWAAGRVAAKQALLDADASFARAPADFSIDTDSAGRPVVSGFAASSSPLGVSIAHAGGLATAVAFRRERPFGLDLEPLADVDPALASLLCAPSENRLLERLTARFGRSGALVRIWTAKEATVKLTGTGLGVPLTQVTLEPTTAPAELAATAPTSAHGGIRCRVRLVEAPGWVAALAWMFDGAPRKPPGNGHAP